MAVGAGAGDLPKRLRERARELMKRAEHLEMVMGDAYTDRLMDRVCEVYRIDRKRLLSSCRIGHVATARHVLMYLLRKDALMSLEAIGHLTQRHHSTVIVDLRRLERRMEECPPFAAMVEKLREGRQQERAA